MIRWNIFALLAIVLSAAWGAAQGNDAASETWAELVSMELDKGRPMPMLTAYALTRREPRAHKRYMDKIPDLARKLEARYAEVRKERGE